MEPFSDSNAMMPEVTDDLGKRICKKTTTQSTETLELPKYDQLSGIERKGDISSTKSIKQEGLITTVYTVYQVNENEHDKRKPSISQDSVFVEENKEELMKAPEKPLSKRNKLDL